MFFQLHKKIIFIALIFLVFPSLVSADNLGQKVNFFIESTYDSFQRSQLTATLQHLDGNAYFYIDDTWWGELSSREKTETKEQLNFLSQEFKNNIYPALTSSYGSEWKPGIDKDDKITVLVHQMKQEVGGYFRNIDEYPKVQAPDSNEREMINLNTSYINDFCAKSFLAHEFTHLIVFNQKDKNHGITEEIWLNEARAEYAPSLVGYDDVYEDSNLERRVKVFLRKPSDSLTEWENASYDYGALTIFINYLVDHYGTEILTDSLYSEQVGIPSINYALEKNSFSEDFSRIFTDWTITVLINDCSLGEKYCYKNPNLINLRVIPFTNFLPFSGNSALKVSDTTEDWSARWYRIVGSKESLKLEFNGSAEAIFKVPCVLENNKGELLVSFLELDREQNGTVYVPDFGKDYTSLTIIPSLQKKIAGFNGAENNFEFSWTASTVSEVPTSTEIQIFQLETEENSSEEEPEEEEEEQNIEEMTEEELLIKMVEIQKQIELLRAELIKMLIQRIAETQEQILLFNSQLQLLESSS